ncbi:MAG: hypothetical protein AAF993_18865, partial [Pseudomonadota bacterium]
MTTSTESIDLHLRHLQAHWTAGLAETGFDGVLLHAGDAAMYFRDDHGPVFKANPYLLQWVAPEFINPGSQLLLIPGR